ncbi:hypothetical protein E2C01_039533 [Portunus trituberculatus]|uniref:Uncharacterized protein n=1 Tax=Portunus trituberculatus TaxID=210409 RepID=A0A5B7FJX3_PORTR|nr:hypothetical protein [Portunus trituberculatus]
MAVHHLQHTTCSLLSLVKRPSNVWVRPSLICKGTITEPPGSAGCLTALVDQWNRERDPGRAELVFRGAGLETCE